MILYFQFILVIFFLHFVTFLYSNVSLHIGPGLFKSIFSLREKGSTDEAHAVSPQYTYVPSSELGSGHTRNNQTPFKGQTKGCLSNYHHVLCPNCILIPRGERPPQDATNNARISRVWREIQNGANRKVHLTTVSLNIFFCLRSFY